MAVTLPGVFDEVWLGDLRLHVAGDDGIEWIVSGIPGWWGSPPGTLEVSQRLADHGGWGGGSWLVPRAITLQGSIIAPDRGTLLAAVDRFSAAASLGAATLRVVEPGGLDRTCEVRRAGPVDVTTHGSAAVWSVALVAPDPRRYGAWVGPLTTGLPVVTGGLELPAEPPWTISATSEVGSVRCANAGTIASRPVLRIDGPVSQPSVAVARADGSTTVLTYWDDLVAGEWLAVDTDAHTVLIGGLVSRRGLVSGVWPEIPPGEAVDVGFRAAAYEADALLTVSYRSAWM